MKLDRFQFTAIALCVLLWGLGLAAYPLMESTEARYGSISAAMVRTGNWIEPMFNGVPHLSKPPFAYWAGAVALSLVPGSATGSFPYSEVPLRLMSTAWLVVCALLTGRLARAAGLSRSASRWASAVSFLSPLAVVQGHMNTGDLYLWAGVLLVMLGWLESERTSRQRALLIGAGWAIGFLAKGHMVLFWTLLPAFVATAVLRRRYYFERIADPTAPEETAPSWRRSLLHPLAWLLFLVVSVPWFAAILHRHPELASYWLKDEIVARVVSADHGRAEPWWYLLPMVPLLVLPWLPELWKGIRRGHGSNVHRWTWVVWILMPLVVFSMSGSKRPNYLLPMVTPLALFVASALHGAHPAAGWRRVLGPRIRTVVWLGFVLTVPFVIASNCFAPDTRAMVEGAGAKGGPLVCFGTEPTGVSFYRGDVVPVYGHQRMSPFAPALDPDEERRQVQAWAGKGAVFLVPNDAVGRLTDMVGAPAASSREGLGHQLVRFHANP